MRAWAEINLDNLSHNISNIKKKVSGGAKLMVVIKADGYGHGFEEVALTALKNGADYLAVATADEAMQIRNKGIDAPLLILGPVWEEDYETAILNDITLTVFDFLVAEKISEVANKIGKTAKIHVKVDTGMSRIGYVTTLDSKEKEDEIADEIVKISKLSNICLEGIFTHFAKADAPKSDFTDIQFSRFISLCNLIEEKGVKIPLRHCCNSAGIIEYPKYHLDMVRSGIITYGCAPSDECDMTKIDLKPVMQLKSKITYLKKISANTPISYGGTYESEDEEVVATFGIGYADGYMRILSNKASVIIGGEKAKLVGRVCMDQTMARVSGIKNIKIGDEVILFGTDGNNTITVDSIALLAGTINYEVLSVVGKRVPRVYIKGGKVEKVLNYLV